MVFVSLGTQDKSFLRLLKEIDKQISLGNIKDKVIVQAGFTKYSSNNMEIFDLMPMNMFLDNIKNCDLLITHGGVGTILDGLKYDKKVIAFPRLSEYGEHVNDHQVQIINEFCSCGYILSGDLSELDDLLLEVNNFVPKKYKSNNYKFNKLIRNYIDSV